MRLLKKQILSALYPNAFCVHLVCPDGFAAVLGTLGASLRAVLVPQPDGSLSNIALSFADDAAYAGNGLYAGAVLAPAAGRISNGRLPVPAGCALLLTRNENGTHTLHGGSRNASFQNWEIQETACHPDAASVTFCLTLPDGLDGFPGTRRLRAVYRLTADHALELELTAVSDKDTYLNLSSHAYFNLSGCCRDDAPGDVPHTDDAPGYVTHLRDAMGHILQISASRVIANRPDFIPEKVIPVRGTPFDFTSPRSLREQAALCPDDEQLKRNCGWNHGFILVGGMETPALICSLPGSPVSITAFTDAPCMVLYSGGYIEEGIPLLSGIRAGSAESESGGSAALPGACAGLFPAQETVVARSVPACGLAFEFQDYPDAPGGHGFPYRLTPAGEIFTRRICWEFHLQ